MKCNNIYIYIFRLQYNGIMPSVYIIEVFSIVIAFVWHEFIPPLLCSIIFIVIFWVSRMEENQHFIHKPIVARIITYKISPHYMY